MSLSLQLRLAQFRVTELERELAELQRKHDAAVQLLQQERTRGALQQAHSIYEQEQLADSAAEGQQLVADLSVELQGALPEEQQVDVQAQAAVVQLQQQLLEQRAQLTTLGSSLQALTDGLQQAESVVTALTAQHQVSRVVCGWQLVGVCWLACVQQG
jgi:uncharacterized phage infection (PIP) family protein YhgE